MKVTQVIERHTPEEIHEFAVNFKLSDQQAGFIEWLRDRYICYEWNYIKKVADEPEK
jgi:hypothetical protein